MEYAVRHDVVDGHEVDVYMHDQIMEQILGRPLQENEEVEHINGNGLDNRRENLRLKNKEVL